VNRWRGSPRISKGEVSRYHKTQFLFNIQIINMKISLVSTIGITTTLTTSAAARVTMRDFYRINSGSQQTSPNSKTNEDLLTNQ
jgi:hypothetical protein